MKTILLEGGNVWQDVVPFDQAIVPDIVSKLQSALSDLNIKVFPVGSAATPVAGKISGDLDVIVDEDQVKKYFSSKDAKSVRKSLSEYLTSKGFETAQSGINVHVKVGVGTSWHQVDIMVTPNAEKVAKFHTHKIPANSPYKGVSKQLLMSMLAKEKNLMWSAWQGLFARDASGKKGEFITDDLDTVAELILGQGATADDLGSVESILAKLSKDHAKDLLDRARQDPNWKEIKINENSSQWFRHFLTKIGDI